MAIKPLLSMLTTSNTDYNYGYPTPAQSPNPGEVTCWLLDTRGLWPGDNILMADGAAEALSLISVPEQNIIKGKMFVQDARMSLASALLKRLFISQTLGMKWRDVRMSRKGNAKHGKPCAVDGVGRPIAGIDFNVSHQGGLVALIGYNGRKNHEYTPSGMVYGMISPTPQDEDVMVGVDIVCVNERDDYRTIDAEGYDGWVDIYEYVFSGEERWSMKYDVDYITLNDGSILPSHEIGRHDRCIERNKHICLKTPEGRDHSFTSDVILDSKLRRFYTYFCYKESYIKLAGEALLAPWLKQLEFFNVRSPKPGQPARCSKHGTWGEEVDDVEVHMHGRNVNDVKMKIQAFEENFMLSTAIQGEIQGIKVPAFKSLNLESDVLAFTPIRQSLTVKSNHNRIVSEPAPRMRTGEAMITSPLVHAKDVPSMNENPYMHAREVPLCLM
ncbi:hypothetical protein LTR37_004138 [Vermiconidia calcicola]|uniref:Uncharacterized protein n=1 Tax=Vermiconidia calcicola TaxID=1690605 RepID=A0ACC3NNL3_9PEZI|nr:hypothetical protein LTR37_004138 [Vermiconidia calcicola]